jgi:hypothetical protein
VLAAFYSPCPATRMPRRRPPCDQRSAFTALEVTPLLARLSKHAYGRLAGGAGGQCCSYDAAQLHQVNPLAIQGVQIFAYRRGGHSMPLFTFLGLVQSESQLTSLFDRREAQENICRPGGNRPA